MQQREQTLNTPENKQRNTGRAEILSLERHKNLKFHTATHFGFARQWLYVPVHRREVAFLARDLPVLFSRDEQGDLSPCLLLKTHAKEAINSAGRWMTGRLPDVMRLYPFGWVPAGNTHRLTLYPEAPHFEGAGERLITSKGKPTQKMNRIMRELLPVQAAFAETAKLMTELSELDVLKPLHITIGTEQYRRTLTLWAVTDPDVHKRAMSSRLRTLLYVHQQSSRTLLAGVQPGEAETRALKRTTEGRLDALQHKSSCHNQTEIAGLIDQTCRQFNVTIEDLRSRKRSAVIKKARSALVNDAVTCDCLEELASQLERTVDTLKKWM